MPGGPENSAQRQRAINLPFGLVNVVGVSPSLDLVSPRTTTVYKDPGLAASCQPSKQASNAIIYLTYAAFLAMGLGFAWKYRKQSKAQFLSSNRTQRAIPLALNFIASGLGSGILFTYPDIGAFAGVQGVLVYALASATPLLLFAVLTPLIRRRTPDGFLLTEWTRDRFGAPAALYLSVLTMVTMFLYMVAELSAINSVINLLTGLNGLPALIVEVAVTTIYTSLGGFRVSFVTDNVQGTVVLLLIAICSISIGTKAHIDPALIGSSGLTRATPLGWKLLYILPVAVGTNVMFLSPFWLRAFAARTDRDLYLGAALATGWVFTILTVVGFTGIIAVWAHGEDKWGPVSEWSSVAFFYLIGELPGWVVGFVVLMVVALSTAVFDSLQSAMVSTASNDLCRNKLGLRWIRAAVVVLIAPVVVVAVKAHASVLQIFLISDIVSAAAIPCLLLAGLVEGLWFVGGWDVICGGCGGIIAVFVFGVVYYGSARGGGELVYMKTLYADDWGVFGAYVAAPVGGILAMFAGCAVRIAGLWAVSKARGVPFQLERKEAAVVEEEVHVRDPVVAGPDRKQPAVYGTCG
ncbi:hypothetical protein Dda_0264 [Drechslerella dactyloides]|uniref:Urea transporter n=1 Tax=Drechslerella dactyloides TaxID=74499 RepID=A0AAD6J5G5_DREDA|nr:hypothetical protein Dda_0264 [Drechslerella dactyloides]